MDLERFFFTQQSLKAFESCPLKYKKRYMENIRWNEPPEENASRILQLGKDFHLMAQRYFMGIHWEEETIDMGNNLLKNWYANLKRCFPLDGNTLYLPECKLRLDTGRGCLEANFDLLEIKEGQITIWDWKTGEMQNNPQSMIRNRKLRMSFQTMVYLFVLKELSFLVTNEPIRCENIKMCYWQPESAAVIAEVKYGEDLHEAYYHTLLEQMNRIRQYDYHAFDKSLYQKNCKYCEFNCLCNRERVDYMAVYGAEELDLNEELIGFR